MDENQTTQEKALAVFEKMTLEDQKKLKSDFPNLYKSLWSKEKVDLSALNQFIENGQPINERVTSFVEFEKLSLSAQLEFKESFPEEYQDIMNLSTGNKSKWKKIKTIDEFEKLPHNEKLQFRNENPEHYNSLFLKQQEKNKFNQ